MRQHGHGRASCDCEHRQTECNRRDSEPRRDDWCGVPPPSVRWIGSRNMTATWAQNKNLATPLPDSSAAQGSFSLLQSKQDAGKCVASYLLQKNGSLASTISIVRKKRDYVKRRIIRFSAHAGTPHRHISATAKRYRYGSNQNYGAFVLVHRRGKKITTIVLDSPRRRQIIFVLRPRKESSSSGQKNKCRRDRASTLTQARANDQEPARPLAKRNLEQEAGTPTLLAASRPRKNGWWPRSRTGWRGPPAKKIQSGLCLLGVNRTLAELANNAAGGRGNLRVFQQASAAWVRGDSDRSFHGPEMQDPGPV